MNPFKSGRGRPKRFRVIDASKPIPISEHKLQTALMDYLRFALRPELEARAIPNGGRRHISVANKLKAEGVKRGSPDIFICLPAGKIAWLEMKAPKGGGLEPEQREFRDKVLALGHSWAMAKSIDEALEFLTSIDALKPAYQRGDAFRQAAELYPNLSGVL